MIQAYKICKAEGVKHFGIHTMVASNELNPDFFVDTARIVFELILEVQKECGVNIEFADLGGGVGIPYRPGQKKVDLDYVAKYADQVVLLDKEVRKMGKVGEVYNSPEFEQIFGKGGYVS